MKFYDLGEDVGLIRLDAITNISPILRRDYGDSNIYFQITLANGSVYNSDCFQSKLEAEKARQELLDTLEAQ